MSNCTAQAFKDFFTEMCKHNPNAVVCSGMNSSVLDVTQFKKHCCFKNGVCEDKSRYTSGNHTTIEEGFFNVIEFNNVKKTARTVLDEIDPACPFIPFDTFIDSIAEDEASLQIDKMISQSLTFGSGKIFFFPDGKVWMKFDTFSARCGGKLPYEWEKLFISVPNTHNLYISRIPYEVMCEEIFRDNVVNKLLEQFTKK